MKHNLQTLPSGFPLSLELVLFRKRDPEAGGGGSREAGLTSLDFLFESTFEECAPVIPESGNKYNRYYLQQGELETNSVFTFRKHLGNFDLNFSLKTRNMKACLQYDIKWGGESECLSPDFKYRCK